jgi:tetratricopeptide (TPR) repeat protein
MKAIQKKRSALLVFLILLMVSPALYSVDEDNPHIQRFRQLTEEHSYQSAYNYLQEPEAMNTISSSDRVILQCELLLDYFVLSTMHQMFALKDIPADQDIMEHRGREGSYRYLVYKPDEALQEAIEDDPENPELYFWLGIYYAEVLQKYNGQWLISNEELIRRAMSGLMRAESLGYSVLRLHQVLGELALHSRDYPLARGQFERALEIDNDDPSYHHNYAISLYYTGEAERALEQALIAAELYRDTFYRADSYGLASVMAIELELWDRGIEYTLQARDLEPTLYRFPQQLIWLYLRQDNPEAAGENAVRFFEMYPTNPSVPSSFIQTYGEYGYFPELAELFEGLLEKHTQDEVRGNIFFHLTIAREALDDLDGARQAMEAARMHFSRVFDADHEVFRQLDRMADQIN